MNRITSYLYLFDNTKHKLYKDDPQRGSIVTNNNITIVKTVMMQTTLRYNAGFLSSYVYWKFTDTYNWYVIIQFSIFQVDKAQSSVHQNVGLTQFC